MSKRAEGKFERRFHDAYDTPPEAVHFLVPHLHDVLTFYEPCAGSGALTEQLVAADFTCIGASDIAPRSHLIDKLDAFALTPTLLVGVDALITNPPYNRVLLHRLIEHLRQLRPTWMLLEADWCFTEQAASHLDYCTDIVAVGRLKFIEDSEHSGFDNYAWCKFSNQLARPRFHVRRKSKVKVLTRTSGR